jgi:hypothetical protein
MFHLPRSIRLKYLLSQSDIFSHFGAVQGFAKESKSKSISGTSASDEFDEDEKAMMIDEIGEGDEEETTVIQPTVLMKQPSIISGQMR